MLNLVKDILENNNFSKNFCCDCKACFTEYDDYTTCPADFDPSDRGCARHNRWLEIKTVLENAEDHVSDLMPVCEAGVF